MVAGTQYRGMFEERMKNVIKRAEASNGKIILFVDEMHMLYSAGSSRTNCTSASNMFKPALARGRIRCVGATTFDEYRQYVEKDPALERRFQKVHVGEPSIEATIAILRGLKQRFQDHHGLEIQDAALVAAAHLGARYITGRQFPHKAIDLIDEACTFIARKMKQIDNTTPSSLNDANKKVIVNPKSSSTNRVKKAIVDPNDVAQVVSRWTGIPVATLCEEEKDKLIHIRDRLHERVIGQDEAVNLVAQAVLRSRAGLDQPSQPTGSFLFLGLSGVGKTELAKALAKQLFDSEKMLVRVDMSEYATVGSVTRLIGAPPRLTDGKGRTVDFKNTIIIMTSNLGSEYLTTKMTGEKPLEVARNLVTEKVQKFFKPELLNRISEIVIFESLSYEQMKEVAKIQIKNMYGARPIRRWVERNVITMLSEMLVKGEAGEG
uniref:AAA+ ATPase domain-containing protein n=1 Tax=Aegilops tauschii subsp. strangulata TaxID=200361 RepID=A0A453AV25_AEGTS